MNVKKIVTLAILASVLFVQEQILAFLPNIQLTIMLVFLYSKTLKFKEVTLILIIHVCLDNLINGSFTPLVIIPMFIGYLFIPIFTNLFLKNAESKAYPSSITMLTRTRNILSPAPVAGIMTRMRQMRPTMRIF